MTRIVFDIHRDEIYGGWEVTKSEHNRLDDPEFFGFLTLTEVREWLRLHFGVTMTKNGAGGYAAEAEVQR